MFSLFKEFKIYFICKFNKYVCLNSQKNVTHFFDDVTCFAFYVTFFIYI